MEMGNGMSETRCRQAQNTDEQVGDLAWLSLGVRVCCPLPAECLSVFEVRQFTPWLHELHEQNGTRQACWHDPRNEEQPFLGFPGPQSAGRCVEVFANLSTISLYLRRT